MKINELKVEIQTTRKRIEKSKGKTKKDLIKYLKRLSRERYEYEKNIRNAILG